MEFTKPVSAKEQIQTLEHLTQGAVAWLAGVTPRAIRAARGLKRNRDGSYHAREVLLWLAGKPEVQTEAISRRVDAMLDDVTTIHKEESTC